MGDDWVNRPGMDSDKPSPYAQVTVMNSRLAELISVTPSQGPGPSAVTSSTSTWTSPRRTFRRGLASASAKTVLEFQPQPHTGCAQFRGWWGPDALRLVSAEAYRSLRLRGANTVVLQSGTVRPGDIARKL